MLAPTYLEMPPLILDHRGAPTYATAMAQPPQPPPGAFLGSFSAASFQKLQARRTWLNRTTPTKRQQQQQAVHAQQQLHPASFLHRDYLQEYREKYGNLSSEAQVPGGPLILADPWMTPLTPVIPHHVHPAVVAAASPTPQSPSINISAGNGGICACPGTKRLGKPCKSCGRRVAAVNKAGGSVRGGTLRGGGAKVRPALLQTPSPLVPTPTIAPMRLRPTPTTPQDEDDSRTPHADPYDLMRRSRLSLQEKQTVGSIRVRSKSVSPTRARLSFPPSIPARRTTCDTHRSRLDEWVATQETSSDDDGESEDSKEGAGSRASSPGDCRGGGKGHKSILECDVSAYELISRYLRPERELDSADSDGLSDNAILEDEGRKRWASSTPTTIPRVSKTRSTTSTTSSSTVTSTGTKVQTKQPASVGIKIPPESLSDDEIVREATPKPPPRRRRIKKSSVIKSILKKTSVASMEDSNTNTNLESSPTGPLHIPTYQEFKQRKKQVQFKASNELEEPKQLVELQKEVNFSTDNDLALDVVTQVGGASSSNDGDSVENNKSERASDVSSVSGGLETGEQLQENKVDDCDLKGKLGEQGRSGEDIGERGENEDKQDNSITRHGPPSKSLERTTPASTDVESLATSIPITPVTKAPRRREGGSIIHIRGDHHKLFLDTMRLRLAQHRPRGDTRVTFAPEPGRLLSPTRPREPPPPPPPTSLNTTSTAPLDVSVGSTNLNNTSIVTVSSSSDTSSNESEYNTLRINIGPLNESLATVLAVNGPNEDNTAQVDHYEPVGAPPQICSKGHEVTISDSSIVTKVENKRRTGRILVTEIPFLNSSPSETRLTVSSPESPYVSTSVRSEGSLVSTSVKSENPYMSTSIRVGSGDDGTPGDRKSWSGSESYVSTSIVVSGGWAERPAEGERGTKFYVTVDDDEDEEEYFDEEIEGHYEMIRDPIYEEISPQEPQAKSIFEGASKYDILSYLVGAKERGIPFEPPSSPAPATPTTSLLSSLHLPGGGNGGGRGSELGSELGGSSAPCSELVSHVSDSSEDCPLQRSSPAKSRRSSAEIERNDSGVGSETSQSSRSRWLLQRRPLPEHTGDLLCEDCEQNVEPQVTDSGVVFAPLVCRKCGKRRSERREIISELLETEVKFGRDLRIMRDEFYRPMLVAGLLTQEQLDAIFLNVPELLEVSRQLAERLQDAVDIALDQGDEDLLTVNVGRLILLDCSKMLTAFEAYCTRQGAASVLLSSLEKEKELLKIFLRVSQMENAVLRRMNLNSFLMVPVQRVTKYPLLLARLYKSTPPHHEARELLKQAQQKIEAHLELMNAEAREVSATKLWRRISIISVPYNRRNNSEPDLNIRLRKLALDVLGWGRDNARFVMEGRLLFTQPTDSNWRKGRTIKLSHLNALLVTHSKNGSSAAPTDPPSGDAMTFPKDNGTLEAALLLLKDKAGRCTLIREPLTLDKCIICTELQDIEECFEVQEIPTKETFIFKAETSDRTREWFRSLQFHAQGLGGWRRRRNALANIMMNGMEPRS